ncbi:MAG: hypothetical protein AAF489_13955 [Bacteroidota bacterium]
MLRFITCSICLLIGLGNVTAQELEVLLDYEVTYVVPNGKKNTIDTISIQLDKKGHFLFMESNSMGLNLARGVFPDPNTDLSGSECSFLLDTQRMLVYFSFHLNDTKMFLQMDVTQFIPINNPMGDDMATLNLLTEKRGDQIQLGGALYDSYLLYPETEPDQPIILAIDEKRPVDNAALINRVIELMLQKSKSNVPVNLDIPNGLIMAIGFQEESLMKAIDARDVNTKINIQHSFNITE